ncbi:MAG: flagellar export protein FliJ [Oleibacter sp.]|nr:flagellar export protein FliJ [Thalassolituus sp.]
MSEGENNYRHPRAKRLAVVLNISQREEQEALKRWGDAEQKLNAETEKTNQLNSYADDYHKQLSNPSQTSVRAGDMHNTLSFLKQIKAALSQQEQRINQLRAQAAKARASYLECHGKVDAMVKMIDRLELEFQQTLNRNEQRKADEWSNRQR